MEITGKEIITFVAVLMRVGLIFSFLPFLGSKAAPMQLRAGLILAISLVITPVVQIEFKTQEMVLVLMKELVFSFVIALAVRFIFYAIDAGAQVVATTMGLSMATVFNPEIGQSTEVARLYGFMAVILFLTMNGHHYFIYAIVKSFQVIPMGGVDLSAMLKAGIKLSGLVFEIAIKIAAPVIAVVMINNILLGALYKLIPQFNIFFVAYPLYLALGFVVLMIGLPFFLIFITGYFSDMRNYLNNLILIGAK
ncbi:MAG TPA: type III secretion protein [Nitrospirae bacterium]|nr:type III secretion protein [Nitrospirota bacterium]